MRIKDTAELALNALKHAGADKAQCILTRTDTDEVNVENGVLALLRTIGNHTSLELTAFCGLKKGSITIGSDDPADITRAAEECVASALKAQDDPANGMNESGQDVVLPAKSGLEPLSQLVDTVAVFAREVQEQYPLTNLRQVIVQRVAGEKIYLNSQGTSILAPIGHYRLTTSFSSGRGNQVGSMNFYTAALQTLSKPLMDTGLLSRLLDASQQQIDTRPWGAKKLGTLIIAPSCLGGLINQMLGTVLNPSVLISGSSRWQNALETQVADSRLSLSSSPGQIVSAPSFTKEGYLVANQPIIQSGVLKSLLADDYVSKKTGLPRSLSPGECLVMAGGDSSLEDMIQATANGLLMYRFSGGLPQASGDFSGIAKNSFIIENGKITGAARETMVSGNLVEMLSKVNGISAETVSDGNSIMPWVSFDSITIQ